MGGADELYLDRLTGDVYASDGTAWTLAGNIRGPQGDTHVPDSTGEPDDRWLKTASGALVYTSAPGSDAAIEAVVPARVGVGQFLRCLGSPTGGGQGFLNSRTYYDHILIPAATTIDTIYAEVTVAGEAGCVLRLGLWRVNESGGPGDLIVDAGTVAADTTGPKSATFAAAVVPRGLYVLGGTVQNAPSTAPSCHAANPWLPGFGAGLSTTLWRKRPLTTGGITGAYTSNPGSETDAVNGNTMLLAVKRSA